MNLIELLQFYQYLLKSGRAKQEISDYLQKEMGVNDVIIKAIEACFLEDGTLVDSLNCYYFIIDKEILK